MEKWQQEFDKIFRTKSGALKKGQYWETPINIKAFISEAIQSAWEEGITIGQNIDQWEKWKEGFRTTIQNALLTELEGACKEVLADAHKWAGIEQNTDGTINNPSYAFHNGRFKTATEILSLLKSKRD